VAAGTRGYGYHVRGFTAGMVFDSPHHRGYGFDSYIRGYWNRIQVIGLQLILGLQYFASILCRPKWKTKPTKMELNKSDMQVDAYMNTGTTDPDLNLLAKVLLGQDCDQL
jgi:hypothetical protein